MCKVCKLIVNEFRWWIIDYHTIAMLIIMHTNFAQHGDGRQAIMIKGCPNYTPCYEYTIHYNSQTKHLLIYSNYLLLNNIGTD